MTYHVTLIDLGLEEIIEVPTKMTGILQVFSDVMPLELPKGLPLQHIMDHKIDLMLGTRLPAKAP